MNGTCIKIKKIRGTTFIVTEGTRKLPAYRTLPLYASFGECCAGEQCVFFVRIVGNFNIRCRQNAQFRVKPGGKYTNH